MSFITFALMVYISHKEAGKKGDKTAAQGWMKRVKRLNGYQRFHPRAPAG